MAVALLALFVALGGSAMAAFVVSSNSQIGPDTVAGSNPPPGAHSNIMADSITAADIRPNAIGSGRVADSSLTGADIADSSLTASDLKPSTLGSGRIADGSLQGADMADDTLTGQQIDEGTLGKVPDASALDGNTSGAFFNSQLTTTQHTSDCVTAQQLWLECAVVPLTVPAGHLWYVTVISTVTANPGNANVEALFCPAYTGPQCVDGSADRVTFEPNQFTNYSSAATGSFFAGTYRLNTAMKWPFFLPASTEADTTTTIIVSDYRQRSLTGP